jgi:hypothetical protein
MPGSGDTEGNIVPQYVALAIEDVIRAIVLRIIRLYPAKSDRKGNIGG